MKLINPTGKKTIQMKENESVDIWLEDFETGSRDFKLIVELLGDNAECHVHGRVQTVGLDQKVWNISQKFKGLNQKGSVTVHGVAEDKSFLDIAGGAILEQTSVDADVNISEKIILLGQGKGKLLPILRVETDKVKTASHGASIAPVEDEKLLFFASRGVSKKSAEKIIKTGFLK